MLRAAHSSPFLLTSILLLLRPSSRLLLLSSLCVLLTSSPLLFFLPSSQAIGNDEFAGEQSRFVEHCLPIQSNINALFHGHGPQDDVLYLYEAFAQSIDGYPRLAYELQALVPMGQDGEPVFKLYEVRSWRSCSCATCSRLCLLAARLLLGCLFAAQAG